MVGERLEAGHRQALDDPEDSRKDVGRGGPLQQRPSGHVEHDPTGTGDGEEHEGADGGLLQAEHDERGRPRQRADGTRRRRPTSAAVAAMPIAPPRPNAALR